MADFIATAGFDAVELIEASELVLGRRSGESVAVGSGKPANKQAQKLLNNIQALKDGTVKGSMNSVLAGAYSSAGVQTFGTFAGRLFTVSGSGTPMIFNFANGISSFGTKSDVVYFTNSINIDYTAATTGWTYMVFAVYSAGTVSLQSIRVDVDTISALQYHVGPVSPTAISATQYWFDTLGNKMMVESGGVFVASQAIFLGGIEITSGSGIFTPVPYGTPVFDQNSPAGGVIHWHNLTNVNRGWTECDGSTLKIANYPLLYNVVGTLYGAAGTTFNIPNIPAHAHGGVTLRSLVKLF